MGHATSIVPTARRGSTGKIASAREWVRLIRSGNTVIPQNCACSCPRSRRCR